MLKQYGCLNWIDIPKFKLKHDDLENKKKQVVLIQSFSTYFKPNSQRFLGHPVQSIQKVDVFIKYIKKE